MRTDLEYMQQALCCARAVKGTTSPNPSVGAVIVRDGDLLGSGATAPVGGPHAEIQAITDAGGEQACTGASIYVTLEPCSHYGKTPPCSEALIRAQFKKVFIAVLDPNPLVAGRGVSMLKEAGIDVEVGLCKDEATELNEDFFHFIQTGRPFIHLKMALTLDGCIADVEGKSKWITGADSRKEVHAIRAKSCAIAVGCGTLRADNSKLDVRHVDGTNPIRIVFGRSEKDVDGSYFQEHAHDVRSILVLAKDGQTRIEKDSYGVELWYTGSADKGSSMQRFMVMAGEEQIDSILVEGGAGVVATLMDEKLVHRITLFYGPCILGGGQRGITLNNPFSIVSPISLDNIRSNIFGTDMMISGTPRWE